MNKNYRIVVVTIIHHQIFKVKAKQAREISSQKFIEQVEKMIRSLI
ncbi:MAG: hypothetical protein ACRCZ9_09485 [Fusobacteriaceae bacterium]